MEIDLSDKTYDGQEEADRFVNGLGQLVDGQRGKDNFRMDINGFGKGKREQQPKCCVDASRTANIKSRY